MKLPDLDVKLTDRVLKRKPYKPEKEKQSKEATGKTDKAELASEHSEMDKARAEEVARLESMSKIKEHDQNLHPLKSEVVKNTLLNLPTKEYVAGLKTMVRMELILTLILVIAVVGGGIFILRNPGSFVIGGGGTQTADDGSSAEATGSGTPTPTAGGTYDPFKGREIKDNRGNTIDSGTSGDGTTVTEKKEYINQDLKFSIEVPVTWKIEEPVVNGVKNTKISDPANSNVVTYISFQSTVPDCSSFKGQGTENNRDIYSYDTIFTASGYVKFGNALCAAFLVTTGKFYVQYAGPVADVIVPMFETFKYF